MTPLYVCMYEKLLDCSSGGGGCRCVRLSVCGKNFSSAAATVVEKSKRRAGERRWCTVYRAKQTEN